MGTVIMTLAVIHGVAAAGLFWLTRSSCMRVDEEGRPLPGPPRRESRNREARELLGRIPPLAPEAPI